MQLQIGVKVIITDQSGSTLVLQRAKSDQPDIAETWDIPGGRINVDESLETALKRELREEIGVVP
ncbi:MAG: NUDIX hydrolase, partial [Candidatus Saccharimonas aalborgensis]